MNFFLIKFLKFIQSLESNRRVLKSGNRQVDLRHEMTMTSPDRYQQTTNFSSKKKPFRFYQCFKNLMTKSNLFIMSVVILFICIILLLFRVLYSCFVNNYQNQHDYRDYFDLNVLEIVKLFKTQTNAFTLDESPFRIEPNSYYIWNQVYNYMTNSYTIFISSFVFFLFEWIVNKKIFFF